MPALKKVSDEAVLEAYAATNSVWAAGRLLGLCGQSVHERLARLSACRPVRILTPSDRAILVRDYAGHADAGTLKDLAKQLGRTKQYICRRARELNLTKRNRKRPYLSLLQPARVAAWWRANPNHKPALGMKHSPASLAKMSEASKRAWRLPAAQRRAKVAAQIDGRLQKNRKPVANRRRGSWRAGWRTVGGKRRYFRSSWEANYARVLELKKSLGAVAEWEHEPHTLRFPRDKAPFVYIPDFLVTLPSGKEEFHEVKGWLDAGSKRKIRLARKHFPERRLVVVGAKSYRALAKKYSAQVADWEVKGA